MNSRRFALAALLAAVCWLGFGCGVGGSGTPVPAPPADFAAGATIPAWIHQLPAGGRGELEVRAAWQNGRHEVVLTRPLRSRPRDRWFAVAVADDGTAHAGVPLVRLTADPAVLPSPDTVVSRRVAPGQVTPDGVLAPGEWDPASFSVLSATPQGDPGPGRYPSPGSVPLTIASAHDDDYLYLAVSWPDPSATRSDLGPALQWDGAQWFRRPHRANDVDGNGLIDGGETMGFTAASEDEDRLQLFFPIEDAAGRFRAGGEGCAASCHGPGGAGHVGEAGRNLLDLWQWRAAATGPARRAQDAFLAPGLGPQDDAGLVGFAAAEPAAPTHMFATPPVGGFEPLFATALAFGAGTAAGAPVLPSIAANAAPFDGGDFNGTGQPPAPWAGTPPFFGNDFLPGFVLREATESAADLETGHAFANGQWTVEFRRRRTTRGADGATRDDDVVFDEDAAFAALLQEDLSTSLSIVDGASGAESRFFGPIVVTTLPPGGGSTASDRLYVHDYGVGFAPQDVTAFTDPTVTVPALDEGPDVGLRLKAGTDGGQRLFVAASWDDATPEDRERWGFDGFFWTRGGGDDELRVLWNPSDPPGSTPAPTTCATLCHVPAGPSIGTVFATGATNRVADLWRWHSGRTAHGYADDLSVDGRLFALASSEAAGAAVFGDSGTAPTRVNLDAANALPAFMAPSDPGADAAVLALGVSGLAGAVPFVDVLAGLPPGGPGPAPSVSFGAEILPILVDRCTECHPSSGGLDLSSHAGVLAGGTSGPAVVPGDPASSRIILRITGQVTPQMPLGGSPLTQAQIDLIAQWIAEGAQDT